MDKKDITMVILALIVTILATLYVKGIESTPTAEKYENGTKNDTTVYSTEVTTTEVVTETVQTETTAQPTTRIKVTEVDVNLMARVVMSESGNQPQAGKIAVAETIINRVLSDEFPNTVYEVVYEPSQYSTADNGEPTVECYEAVYTALREQTHPSNMYYFRGGYYHSWATDYIQIKDHYFSLGE
jgi:N-acetylmuramoyl-L-alanine amidase